MMRTLLATALLLAPLAGWAGTTASLLDDYRRAAAATPGFSGFSAARGNALFHRPGRDWSCSTCHTDDPREQGRHVVTGKAIPPLSPLADAKRFTDAAHAEKWFKRNCRDVIGRECSVLEKGDLLTYLLSLRN